MIDYQVEQINNNNNSTHLVPSHWGMGGDDADIPNIWQYMHQVALRTDLKKNIKNQNCGPVRIHC